MDDTEEDPEASYLQEQREYMRRIKSRDVRTMKQEVAEWIGYRLGEKISPKHLIEELRSGVKLLHLAKDLHLHKHNVGQINQKDIAEELRLLTPDDTIVPEGVLNSNALVLARQRSNIAKFLEWCNDIGVKRIILFESEDLVSGKNEFQVINCLLNIARIVSEYGIEPPESVKEDLKYEEQKRRQSIHSSKKNDAKIQPIMSQADSTQSNKNLNMQYKEEDDSSNGEKRRFLPRQAIALSDEYDWQLDTKNDDSAFDTFTNNHFTDDVTSDTKMTTTDKNYSSTSRGSEVSLSSSSSSSQFSSHSTRNENMVSKELQSENEIQHYTSYDFDYSSHLSNNTDENIDNENKTPYVGLMADFTATTPDDCGRSDKLPQDEPLDSPDDIASMGLHNKNNNVSLVSKEGYQVPNFTSVPHSDNQGGDDGSVVDDTSSLPLSQSCEASKLAPGITEEVMIDYPPFQHTSLSTNSLTSESSSSSSYQTTSENKENVNLMDEVMINFPPIQHSSITTENLATDLLENESSSHQVTSENKENVGLVDEVMIDFSPLHESKLTEQLPETKITNSSTSYSSSPTTTENSYNTNMLCQILPESQIVPTKTEVLALGTAPEINSFQLKNDSSSSNNSETNENTSKQFRQRSLPGYEDPRSPLPIMPKDTQPADFFNYSSSQQQDSPTTNNVYRIEEESGDIYTISDKHQAAKQYSNEPPTNYPQQVETTGEKSGGTSRSSSSINSSDHNITRGNTNDLTGKSSPQLPAADAPSSKDATDQQSHWKQSQLSDRNNSSDDPYKRPIVIVGVLLVIAIGALVAMAIVFSTV